MKYCPNCGSGVEPDAASCESCGASLAAVQATLAPAVGSPGRGGATPSTGTMTDLTPQQLRREIRWGVFQGILLALAIGLVIYLLVVVLVLGAVWGTGGISGG